MRLCQLILRVRERVQLRRLLGEQHDEGEKDALQRAPALIGGKEHARILAELRLSRHFACSRLRTER
jgi:hypothetical protein